MCEATRTLPAEVKVRSDDPNYPYLLSREAAKRLRECALTPLEWYRLTAIHGAGDFWLHEDMYDSMGKALQPGIPVPKKPGERLPSFEEVRNDMEALLDYFFGGCEFDDNERILEALGKFNKDELFEAVQRRLGTPAREALEGAAYNLLGRVLPQKLAATLDRKWLAIREGPHGELAIPELASASIPAVGVRRTLELVRRTVARLRWPDETKKHVPNYYFLPSNLASTLLESVPINLLMDLVLEMMDKLPPRRRAFQVIHALTWVRGERVLQWIERNAAPPISYEWGTAAACNRPTWNRLSKWLDRGRPLSLVALDALKNCRGFDPDDEWMAGIFKEESPKIRGRISLRAVRKKLEQYLRVDPVRRVRKAVDTVLASLDKIFEEFSR
jgi:hypothetical protein